MRTGRSVRTSGVGRRAGLSLTLPRWSGRLTAAMGVLGTMEEPTVLPCPSATNWESLVKAISHPRLTIATVALLAAGLAGCSSGDDSSTSTSAPVEPSPVQSTATDGVATETTPTESLGTDESSEEEAAAVCEAGDNLRDSVADVVDDLRSGNLDDARDELDDVRSDRDALTSAIDDLGAAERDRLQPESDQLSTDIDALSDASGLSGWQSALSDVRSSLGDLVDSVDTNLGCGD